MDISGVSALGSGKMGGNGRPTWVEVRKIKVLETTGNIVKNCA